MNANNSIATPSTYEDVLEAIMAKRDDVVIMTAENRAALRNLPAKLGPRFIDVGIAEMTMIGAAAGLAARGRVPVVHALSTFLTLRAYEFVRTDVGIAGLPVKLVGCVPGFLSAANGPTHQAIEDIAIMRQIPKMCVWCPADNEELLDGLPSAVADPNPWYIRFNTCARAEQAPGRAPFEVGKAETLTEGDDVTIMTHGFLVAQALDAAARLAERGIMARVVNLRMPWPIDEDAVLAAARETPLVVTIEDHFVIGGLYSIVAETLLKRRITARVHPIALDGRWFKPALVDDVLEYEGFTGAKLAARIHETLKSSAQAS